MLLSREEVRDYLPHREPFLFVDTVLDIQLPENVKELTERRPKDLVGSKVRAQFEIREDLEILKGHFPGNPILPGVVQVEMMAQTAAFSSLGLFKSEEERKKFRVETLLLGIDKTRFRKPLLPGMVLTIESTISRSRGEMAWYTGQILVEGQVFGEAEFMAQLKVFPKENP